MVDESSEKKWEKLNSSVLQTSEPTPIPHRDLGCIVSGLFLVRAPFTFAVSTFQSVASGPSYSTVLPQLHFGASCWYCKHRSINRKVVCKTVNQIQCGDLGFLDGKGYIFLGVCVFV